MRAIKATVAVVLVSLLVSGSVTWAESPVHFNDPNLKERVEIALGKGNPTPTDMLGLTSLDAGAGRTFITDLTGLEYAHNLTSLDLTCNGLSNIRPLAGLTSLTDLGLGGNRCSDLSPLAGLTNLTSLRRRQQSDQQHLGSGRIEEADRTRGLLQSDRQFIGPQRVDEVEVSNPARIG